MRNHPLAKSSTINYLGGGDEHRISRIGRDPWTFLGGSVAFACLPVAIAGLRGQSSMRLLGENGARPRQAAEGSNSKGEVEIVLADEIYYKQDTV